MAGPPWSAAPFSTVFEGSFLPVSGLTIADRIIISNVPSLDSPPPNLQTLILKLNPHVFTPPMLHPSPAEGKIHIEAVDNAIDLCSRLLWLDATKRLTASAALRHKFLFPMEGESQKDLALEEVLNGVDGKCGNLHVIENGKRECCTWLRSLADSRQIARIFLEYCRTCNLARASRRLEISVRTFFHLA